MRKIFSNIGLEVGYNESYLWMAKPFRTQDRTTDVGLRSQSCQLNNLVFRVRPFYLKLSRMERRQNILLYVDFFSSDSHV